MWLLIAILAYFFLALVSLFDRYILVGPLSNPKAYVFFVGILGIFSLALVPFGFAMPGLSQILLSLLAGAVWMLAIFLLFLAISQSEASRVVPAIGGFLPFFTLIISFIFSPVPIIITFPYVCALLLMIAGSVLIVLEKGKPISLQNIKTPLMAAAAFGLGFFLMKLVYLEQSFVSGFVLMRMGGILAVIPFLFSAKTRQAIFKQKPLTQKRVSIPLILGQIFGGLGFVLQNYSVVLADMSQLPLINALEGIRYVFLLLFIIILSRKFPNILKEEISKKTLLQKVFAVLLIGAGLAFLAFQ